VSFLQETDSTEGFVLSTAPFSRTTKHESQSCHYSFFALRGERQQYRWTAKWTNSTK